MGFESFRVELRGGSATVADAEAAVRRLPYVQPDSELPAIRGSAFYTVDDGYHVIEIEVAASPVKVSCRFTLCHPSSIDSKFLGLVRELLFRLGMEATICDDIRPEHARSFSTVHFAEFVDIASISIARRRDEWIANFGPEQMPARTAEVYEKIILPRCVPIAG